MCGGGLRGESCFVQDRVHEVSRSIAGKRSAGAIGTMRPGREAQDKHARIGVAESRYRLAPVVPLHVGAALFFGNPAAVCDQPRAAGAGDNLRVKLIEGKWHHGYFLIYAAAYWRVNRAGRNNDEAQ